MRGLRWHALTVITLAGLINGASAQKSDDYPVKPIRVIVPFAPGGPPDAVGRPVLQKLSEVLGQPVIFDNRPGAAGLIGTEAVARSPKDGYTALYTTGSHNTNSLSYKKMPYDAHRDFAPITQVARSYGQIMTAHPSLPVKTPRDVANMARAKPGSLHYGSAGVGNITHLAAELFMSIAKVKLVHVPYKGGAPAFNDLIGGHIELMFPSLTQVGPHIKAGRARALAIAGPVRPPLFPDLPTFSEVGYPGVDLPGWHGMWFPAGTPPERAARIQQEIAKILKLPDVQARIADAAAIPVGSTPEEFATFLQRDYAFFGKLMRTAGIEPQ